MPRVQKSPRWKGLGATERPMAVSYGLIAAILVLGAAGYMLDLTFDTSPWLLIAFSHDEPVTYTVPERLWISEQSPR